VILHDAMEQRPKPKKPAKVIPFGSMAWNDQERDRAKTHGDMFTRELY